MRAPGFTGSDVFAMVVSRARASGIPADDRLDPGVRQLVRKAEAEPDATLVDPHPLLAGGGVRVSEDEDARIG